MRKSIILLVLIAICGGYSAYWYKKSGDFKEMLAQSITTFNAHAKNLNKGADVVRYDSIQASGYPLSMTLEIVKPVIDLPMTTILQQANDSNNTAAVAPATAAPNWIEEISSDKISVTANMAGDYITSTVFGERTIKSIVDGTVRHTLVATPAANAICHLGVQKAGKEPWTVRPLFTDLPTFLDTFHSFDCDDQQVTFKDQASGEVLSSSDGFHVATSNEASDGGNHKLFFALEAKNSKLTAAADPLVKEYMQLINTISGKPNAAASNISLSEYGTQNVKISLLYNGPVVSDDLHAAATHVHFDIDPLQIDNALSNTLVQVHFDTAPQGNDRTVSLKVHTESNVTERYDQLLVSQVSDLITNLLQQPAKTPSDASFANTLSAMGAPPQTAAAIMPKLHTFGKTSFDIDANAQGPNGDSKVFLMQSKYTLNAFNWIAEPYGFKLAGSVPNKLPMGDATFTCLNCDAMLNDLGDYGMRVEALWDKSQPGKKPYISKNLVDGTKAFIHGISTDNTSKDPVVHVVMNESGVTVSNKQIPEVMLLFQNTIAPFLPQPQAQAPVAR